MQKKLVWAVFIILFSGILQAQTYEGVYHGYYNYQQPDARSEAMGKVNVMLYGSSADAIYNPAASSFTEGINANISLLTPKYYIDMSESKHNLYGVSYNSKKYGAASFNYRYYTIGYLNPILNKNPLYNGDKNKPEIYNYSFNYSYMLYRDFSVGFNVNYFEDKQIVDAKGTAWYFDLGLMKRITGDKELYKHSIMIGGSITNITNAQVDLKLTNTTAEESIGKVTLPSELKLGAAYEYENKLQLAGFTIFKGMATAEYCDIINAELFTSEKFGAELTLMEMLKVRLGYYYERINHDSRFNNKEYLSEFTYGFGLVLPVAKISGMNIPVTFQLDYANLKAPSYNSLNKIDKNFSPMNFNVKIDL